MLLKYKIFLIFKGLENKRSRYEYTIETDDQLALVALLAAVCGNDGELPPELMNLADVFNYLDKYDLVINEMSYYQKGAKLSDDTTFFDFTDSKPLELRITTTER